MTAGEAFTVEPAEPGTIAIADLRRDLELSCRANGISKATAREYGEAMKGGAIFPPVVVFTDSRGVHWLADGFHRTEGAELAGLTEIAVERRPGSRKDALLFAAGANAIHGRPRSPSDKRRAVSLLLAEPTWAKRADNWIAKHANVSHTFVAKLRATCNVSSESIREAADGREIDVSRIGKSEPSADAKLEQLTTRFRKLLSDVPHEQLRRFQDLVLEALGSVALSAEPK